MDFVLDTKALPAVLLRNVLQLLMQTVYLLFPPRGLLALMISLNSGRFPNQINHPDSLLVGLRHFCQEKNKNLRILLLGKKSEFFHFLVSNTFLETGKKSFDFGPYWWRKNVVSKNGNKWRKDDFGRVSLGTDSSWCWRRYCNDKWYNLYTHTCYWSPQQGTDHRTERPNGRSE